MKNFESITIREATKFVYPKMNDATIHQWMAKGIFTPYVYEPPPTGPGRGCKLDLPDLVTIGLIHSLLQFGLRFEELKSGNSDKGHLLHFREVEKPFEERWGNIQDSNRRIQNFISRYKFDVTIHWPKIYGLSTQTVLFYPTSDYRYFSGQLSTILDTDPTAVGHVFINCDSWFHYVCGQLKVAAKM